MARRYRAEEGGNAPAAVATRTDRSHEDLLRRHGMGPFIAFTLARRISGSESFRKRVRAARGCDKGMVESDHGEAVLAPEGTILRIKLLRVLVVFVGLSVAAWITGLLVAQRLTYGAEDSDEFQSAVIMGGKESRSRAPQLKSATAITCLGGMALDLREATLDPSGASLELRTTMGGIEVRVPPSWAVEVDQETLGGALEVDVTSQDDLPEDAPKLHIHAVTRMGGGLITARRD